MSPKRASDPYAFESTTRPNIVWVDFDKLSFEPGTAELKLDLVSQLALEGGLSGDVSHQFKSVGPLAQDALDDGLKMLELIAAKQDEFEKIEKAVLQGMKTLKGALA